MRLFFEDRCLGEFDIPFALFRRIARRLRIKYQSFEEGGVVYIDGGREDAFKLYR